MDALVVVALVALDAFAAWRVARMVAGEDGPFDVFVRARAWADTLPVKQRTNTFGGVESTPHWVMRGINCVLCVSVWTSLLAVLLLPPLGISPRDLAMAWFAVAGLAAFINMRSIR